MTQSKGYLSVNVNRLNIQFSSYFQTWAALYSILQKKTIESVVLQLFKHRQKYTARYYPKKCNFQ
jgi:Zn/Cd-binding protein ZinT